ncbi:TonB-dependent receptor [Ramlibacter terrae]|uniref:TonB-dependent receptor n=1 Tax=Ramlibacter terrae TaxID=2732511 RepID=A0ABX6NZS1_9BURK|nr:TonB-dependent receptor [Ramlibacter terrae]
MQRLADVAGSVYVINQEDIRRSGASTLPEVLRLAPNLSVARADAAQYAISARGFASVLANKILVLIDGRTIYSPLFSGVFWEVQDLMLEDIERIEVLSGAGGTLYGSNAVNGVINIITRAAADTIGSVVKVDAGTSERTLTARHGGGTAADMPWRLYAKRYEADSLRRENGALLGDPLLQRSQAGFRTDRTREQDLMTLQGDIYEGKVDQLPSARTFAGANLLGRWTREHGAGRRTQLQAYWDRTERDQPGTVRDRLDTFDVEVQQTSRPAEGHDLLLGAGYRLQYDRTENIAPAALRFVPSDRRLRLGTVYAQDEFGILPGVRMTLGLKAEHNTYTGLEWLPTARLAWQARPGHLLWASASRAVRTPSRIDREVFLATLPLGGTEFDSEVAKVFELGYRAQPRASVSYAVTLFHHDFERLRSVDLRPGGAAFGNSHEAHLHGIETRGSWRIADAWRLQASYAHQRMEVGTRSGSVVAPGTSAQLGDDPRNRARVSLGWDLSPQMEVDLAARYVGHTPAQQVPAYTAVDFRWGWRVQPGLELSLTVRNLNDPHHAEWGPAGFRAEVPRSVMVKAVWRL